MSLARPESQMSDDRWRGSDLLLQRKTVALFTGTTYLTRRPFTLYMTPSGRTVRVEELGRMMKVTRG